MIEIGWQVVVVFSLVPLSFRLAYDGDASDWMELKRDRARATLPLTSLNISFQRHTDMPKK